MIVLSTTQKVILGLTLTGVLGFVGYKIYKKKKGSSETEVSDDTDTSDGSTTNSNGIVYWGLTSAQTTELQKKLNSFISSGKLGLVLGWLGDFGVVTYSFKKQNNVPYYKASNSKNWYQYYPSYNGYSTALKNAYTSWLVSDVAKSSLTPAIINNATNVTTPNTDTSSALSTFKNSIAANMTNGKLKVDGAYGKNTKAVVMALQIYLNTVKGSGLNVDGKYGTNTDTATGWHICS